MKRELMEAEAAAEAKSSPSGKSPSGGEIPVGALVIVEAKEGGGGSGFIAEMKGRKFFVTNIHVLAAARGAMLWTVDGQELQLPDIAFLSKKRDLAIVPLNWTGNALMISNSLAFDDVSIGDRITVMGNSDGAGVATKLRGDVDGIGPEEIEISAKFVPGNSGSPIVHDKLGKVIGIVSYMKDLSQKDKWTEDSELSDIRRFGFRLDGEIEWHRISLEDLYEQGELFANFEERTYLLARTIYMLKNKRTIMTGYASHDSLGYLFEPFGENFSWRRGLASANNIRKLDDFVDGLERELISDRSSTKKALKVNYFKERFEQVDSLRDYSQGELKQVSF
ncbi:S1 family peptidase [Coraliomargarita sinensis]|uniref:S1 family peptidase n=1 Tax=Coraliomargarita sinensis TaxID=2174842 RepID=UPI001304E038|nr:serine protease [Coraliomargarita sinensis]